ncbi:hypothetical protein LCGC14_1961770, partial [marine sediment metagenome]
MATRVWEGGNAPAVAHVSKITVTGTWATNDTATLTCGSVSVTFTVGGTQTIGAVVAGLVSAWNAAAAGEMAEATAADASPDITFTSDTAGMPIEVTGYESTAGNGALGAQTDTTPNSGPNCWDSAANWSYLGTTRSLPVTGDDMVYENSPIPCLYGLAQSGITLASLTRLETFTGTLGLPRNNTLDANNPYVEYRPTHLEIGATSVYLGMGNGGGSGRFNLDTGSVQTDLNIWDSGTPLEAGIPPILWKGTHSSNTVTINKGSVGIAFFAGETATINVLNVSYAEFQATDVDVICGKGVTFNGTVDIDGGTVEINSNGLTVNQRAGVLTVLGGAAISTTLRLDGGTCHWNSVGTLTLPIISGGGVLDFRRDGRTRTVVD